MNFAHLSVASRIPKEYIWNGAVHFSGERLVIYINVTTKRKFSLKNLDAKFEELGNRGVFALGKMKRGSQSRIELHHNRYQGRVEIGEVPEQRLIYASTWGNEEERLASSWIEWMIRYFSTKIATIEVLPEEAKVGKD